MKPYLETAITWLTAHCGPGRVGLGWDLATTTGGSSNPNAFAVTEEYGPELIVRAILTWKTADPEVSREITTGIIDAVAARKEGGRAKKLCIDATNERFYATDRRKELAAKIPVELVIASESVQLPGMEEPMNYKQWLGGQLVAILDDNHLTLPPPPWIKADFRRVKKEKGMFVCELGANGEHGDTFDAVKLSVHALRMPDGIESVAGIRIGNAGDAPAPGTDFTAVRPRFRPFIPSAYRGGYELLTK